MCMNCNKNVFTPKTMNGTSKKYVHNNTSTTSKQYSGGRRSGGGAAAFGTPKVTLSFSGRGKKY